VQNVSRDLRHFFVEAPEHELIKADYSQAQMRILAHLCREEELKRLFKDPSRDVHTETSDLLGLHDRNVAKEINFGICYGMTPVALCRKINDLKEKRGETDFIGVETALDYMSGFHTRYPRIKFILDLEWKRIKSQPMDKRGVSSLTGRFRRFNRRATSRVERQFRVTWPQQIEADLIKTSMVRLDKIFKKRELEARLVMMIHDSIWVETPSDEEPEIRSIMEDVMTTAGELDVPLEVDFE
jgi:DNA polymerase-1